MYVHIGFFKHFVKLISTKTLVQIIAKGVYTEKGSTLQQDDPILWYWIDYPCPTTCTVTEGGVTSPVCSD